MRTACALLVLGTAAQAQVRKVEVAAPAPNVTVALAGGAVQVAWGAVGGVKEYVVLRAANAKSAAAPVSAVPAGTLSFVDKAGAAGMVYQVVAAFADGRKGTSAAVTVVNPATTPSERAPVQTGAVAGAVGGNSQVVNAVMLARVSSFTPAKAATGASGKITISGSGFLRKPELAVKFTGPSGQQDQAAQVLAKTDGAIDVMLPAGARTGKVLVEVGTGADLYGAYSNAVFTVPTPIEVARFAPDSAARGGTVTVYGKNFSMWDVIEVQFRVLTADGVPVTDRLPAKATNITDGSFNVVVPQAAITGPIAVSVRMTNADFGHAYVGAPGVLKVGIPFAVAGFDPGRARRNTGPQPGVTFGPTEPSTNISGTGFLKQSQFAIYFTGATGAQDQLVTRTYFVNDTRALVGVPAGARTGKVKIVSGTGASSESSVSSAVFTVMDPIQVTGFTPSSAARGDKVHISGHGFLNRGGVNVQLNNGAGSANQSASITATTDTSVDVIVPAGAGSGVVSVTSGAGMDFETVTSSAQLSVVAPPLSVEAVSPLIGGPGTSVQITGYGFASPIVNFANGQRAAITSVTGGAMTPKGPLSVITVTVPQGAVTGPVTVLTAEGTASSKSVFTIPTIKPVVTDFQPKTGTVGTVVTLTGTFDPVAANNAVIFNGWGSSAVTATAASSTGTSIQVAVPAGAHTGPLTVPSILGNAGLIKPFFLPPVITGFSVAAAPAGYDITINGDNFYPDPSLAVKFNGVAATSVTAVSNSRITVTVPSGATTGTVTVQTPGGTAASPTPFTVR